MAEKPERDDYQEYLKARHEAYVSRRNSLNDLAFKTSERYDQWVLTLSGGALAISLTFLEKIAPHPAGNTLFLLGLSWLAYIVALLAGFCAIWFSRQAIYEEVGIDDAKYSDFRQTTTRAKPEGEQAADRENKSVRTLGVLNKLSLSCLIAGTFFLCCFAFGNLAPESASKTPELPPRIDVNVNILNPPTDSKTTTNKVNP